MAFFQSSAELAGNEKRRFRKIKEFTMDLQLKNKKALVLGASTGIGRAIAEVLVQEGATVAICSRNLEKVKKTAREIGAEHFFTCDLSKAGEAKNAVEKAIAQLGGVDILVTNTGGPNKGNFAEV